MAAKRKYWNPGSTTVKTEKWKLNLLEALKIDHTEAFNRGVDEILQVSMDKGLVKSEFLSRVLSEKRAELDELQTTIKLLEDALQGTLIPEAVERKRQAVVEEFCVLNFGKNPIAHSQKLPENDHRALFCEYWQKLAQQLSEDYGLDIQPRHLIECLRRMIHRQLNPGRDNL